MRILLTGATGFIGRALTGQLLRDGHDPVAWVRSVERARSLLGPDVELISAAAGGQALAAALSRCGGIVNLAGEPLVRRWTTARRAAIVSSRVDLTRRLVRACAAASPRPRVLVSGSGVGYYGDRGSEPLTEQSGPGADFLARLALAWEGAANEATALGLRVVTVRTGIVLGDGGALAQMRPAFVLGLGGPLGPGTQYMPWIHLEDHLGIVAEAIGDERFAGPINAVGPQETTNREFTRALGRALHRPAVVPVPAFGLRLLFGEASTTMLSSQRVQPARLRELGFRFVFPALDAALADAVRQP